MAEAITTESCRQVVSRLRMLIRSPQQFEPTDAVQVVTTYSDYLRQINERLRRCSELATAGHWQAAIELARRAPDLDDLCVATDFPEQEALPRVADHYSVPHPPQLDVERHTHWQEIHERFSALEPHIRRLRLAVLRRMPVPGQLSILREILSLEANHPRLQGDIRAFEKAWFTRVDSFVAPLVAAGDVDSIEMVVADFTEGNYLETPPSGLVDRLRRQAAMARQARLPVFANELRTAYTEPNQPRLDILLKVWERECALAGVNPADPRMKCDDIIAARRAECEAAKLELERGELRDAFLQELQNPLGGIAVLKECFERAKRANALQDDDESRYHETYRRRCRGRMVVVVACLATLVLGAVVVGVVFWQYQARLAREVARTGFFVELDSRAAKGDLNGAQQLLDDHPEFSDEPRAVDQIRQLRNEKSRQQKLASAIGKISTLNDLGEIDESAAESKPLCRTDAERQDLQSAVNAARDRVKRAEGAVEKDFVNRIAAWNRDAESLIKVAALPLPDKDLDSLEKRRVALSQERTKRASDAQYAPVLNEFDRVKLEWQALRERSESVKALRRVIETVTQEPPTKRSLTRLANELSSKEFLAIAGKEPAAKAWKQASDDLATWLAVQDEVERPWPMGSAEGGKLPEVLVGSPIEPLVRRRNAVAQSLAKRETLAPLMAICDRGAMKGLFVVWISNDKLPDNGFPYYATSDVSLKVNAGTMWRYVYREKEVNGELRCEFLSKLYPEKNDRVFAAPAPQSQFAENWLKKTKAQNGDWYSNWASFYREWYDLESSDNPGKSKPQLLDPILKAQVLSSLVAIGREASEGLKTNVPEFVWPVGQFANPDQKANIELWPGSHDSINADRLAKIREDALAACGKAPKMTDQLIAKCKMHDELEVAYAKSPLFVIGIVQGDETLRLWGRAKIDMPAKLFVVVGGTWDNVGSYSKQTGLKLRSGLQPFAGLPVLAVVE